MIYFFVKKNKSNFTISTWTSAGASFDKDKWEKKISYYDSLGISEILVGGAPNVLKKIIIINYYNNKIL